MLLTGHSSQGEIPDAAGTQTLLKGLNMHPVILLDDARPHAVHSLYDIILQPGWRPDSTSIHSSLQTL